MATLPNLVEAIARCDGRDRATLDQFARIIREAGDIQTGKRGRGAAEMTVRDAANLIIGMNGADTPSGAPEAVKRFRSLRTHFVQASETCALDVFDLINKTKTFGEALELLISHFQTIVFGVIGFIREGYDDEKLSNIHIEEILNHNWTSPVSMEIKLRRYHAEINMRSWVGDGATPKGNFDAAWRTEFHAEFIVDVNLMNQGNDFYGRKAGTPARSVTISINARMLLEIWKAIYGEVLNKQ